MTGEHLNEEEIQDFALAGKAISPTAKIHLSQCLSCEEKVRAYRLFFSSVKEIPPSEFGFDVSELVLAQLEKKSPRYGWSHLAIALLIGIGVVFSGLLIWNVRHLLSDYGAYLLLLAGSLVLLIQIGSSYQKYLTQINLLKK